MKYKYDLHIHSCLSPCGDILNTPNNLVNMAVLKGLDIISITDHNSLKQLSIINDIVDSYDILLLPGVEVSVKEGFHVLCYFKNLDLALKFDKILEKYILLETFDENFYGEQVVTDEYDNEDYKYPYLLINSTTLGVQKLSHIVKELDGLLYFAHIDKNKFSGLNYLSDNDISINGIELSLNVKDDFISDNDFIKKYQIIKNSDAHTLQDISEGEEASLIELNEFTLDALFSKLKGEI